MPKIYIASDHAGFDLKEALVPYIGSLGYEVEDLGAFEKTEDDDYPDYILPCAQKVAGDPGSFGVILGASGQGEAMVANRVEGVRAAVFYGNPLTVQTDAVGRELPLIASVRMHNDANILSLGARFIAPDEAKDAVSTFLSTSFTGEERHVRRISKY